MIGLPHTFWWLWGGTLICALATFVFPFLALFLSDRGFSVSATGLVMSLFGFGMLIAGPVGGWLADHLGRRTPMVAGLASGAVLTAALGFLSSPIAIAAALLLFGMALQTARPAILATIADVVPAEHRVRAYGLGYWANNVGMSVSLLVGGLLASHGWSLLFLADAATTLAFAALVWRKVPETHRPGAVPRASSSGSGRGYRAVLSDRTLIALLGAQFVLLLVFCQHQVTAPIDMARHGLSPAAFGRVLSVNAVLVMVLQPFGARITRGRDPAHVLAMAAVLIGAGYGAYGLCATEAQFAGATALWTLGEILGLPQAGALVAELAPSDLRGRYQGLAGLVTGGAMAVAPVLGSAYMQRFGSRALWSACLALGLAVAAVHLAIGGSRRRLLAARAEQAMAARPSPTPRPGPLCQLTDRCVK